MKKLIPACLFLVPYLMAEVRFHDTYDLPVTLKGYVKHESYWDSRQVIGFGENQVLVFPSRQNLDQFCDDINARAEFDSVPIQSRLRMEVDGPPVGSAQSYATIEGHFFGSSTITNIFSLRHAYLHLVWDNVEILAGQYWHPLYSTDAEVRTISFNAGVPIAAFARNPQIRVKYKDEGFDISFCAACERGFVSDGPIGFSNTYMRNAVVPNLDIKAEGHIDDHIIGACLDYKCIVPRLETNDGLKTRESLHSGGATFYTSLNWETLAINNKILFMQNGTDQSLIGGYAVKTIDESTDKRTYTNINTISLWTDWQFRPQKSFKFGFFLGWIKNLGAGTCIEPNVVDEECVVTDRRIFGFGNDIDNLVRFAPRITWTVEDFEFATEVEYTRSAFGCINEKGGVEPNAPTSNTRLLLALFYFI